MNQLHIQIIQNKWNEHKQNLTFNTQGSGGKINHPGQLAPTPATQHLKQNYKEINSIDLNYDYNSFVVIPYSGSLKKLD